MGLIIMQVAIGPLYTSVDSGGLDVNTVLEDFITVTCCHVRHILEVPFTLSK